MGLAGIFHWLKEDEADIELLLSLVKTDEEKEILNRMLERRKNENKDGE